MGPARDERLTKRALYMQVYDILANRIVSGAIENGSYLPNEYELSKQLDVSIGTIRKAVDLLAAAQMVVRQQGKGTRVYDQRWIAVHDKVNRIRFGVDATVAGWHYKQLSCDMKPAGEEIASILNMDPRDLIHHVHDFREFPPNSRAYDILYVPVAVISDMKLCEPNYPTIIKLARENQIEIGRVEERVSAVAASAYDADVLSVEQGAPLLKKVRVIYTADGVPLEHRISYISTEDGYYWSQSK